MKNLQLIESDLRKLVRLIFEEEENNIIKIAPEDFLKMFRYTNSVDAILNLKKYKMKQLVFQMKVKY